MGPQVLDSVKAQATISTMSINTLRKLEVVRCVDAKLIDGSRGRHKQLGHFFQPKHHDLPTGLHCLGPVRSTS